MSNSGRKRKMILRIFFSILEICIILSALSSCLVSQTSQSDEKNDYDTYVNEVRYANQNMPKTDALGDYETFSVHRKTTKQFIWRIDTVSLQLSYSEPSFEEEIRNIEQKYTFIADSKEDLLDISAYVNGYIIRIVDKDESFDDHDFYDFPKCFMMIGINQSTRSIIYLFHYDFDLDEIDNLDEYIKKYYKLD